MEDGRRKKKRKMEDNPLTVKRKFFSSTPGNPANTLSSNLAFPLIALNSANKRSNCWPPNTLTFSKGINLTSGTSHSTEAIYSYGYITLDDSNRYS